MSAPTSAAYLPPSVEPAADVLVEIVADGGPRLGFGHVGRCLALWEEFEGRAAFHVRDEAVAGFLQARGVPLAPSAAAPIALLDRAQPTGEQEVRSLRAAGRRVVLLDDLGGGRMAADAVIDPPTAAAWPPAAGQRLAGFEHVLLRREVRKAAVVAESEQGVLLAMGGSDPAGLTPPLAEALDGAGVETTIALGPGYLGPSPRGTVIGADAFVPALARAALLVTGYGHSLLEAAYLGVPAISVVFREEHLPHARAFCSNDTACMLDMTEGPRPAELAALAGRLLGDPGRRAKMAKRGRELVDGAGAARIAAALRALA
jgi:spore coat polysaccharide biosynthesis predicted glycosyltransferase SpsG